MPSEQQPEMGLLSDIVADGRFVVFTGAGVSMGLRLKQRPQETLPSWPQLLQGLRARVRDAVTEADDADVEQLLHERAVAAELIEAASVLAAAVPAAEWRAAIRGEVEAQAQQSSEVHDAITRLRPRGIVTFNYDDAHEQSLQTVVDGPAWVTIPSPWEETSLRTQVASRFDRPFLLKAHGSLRDDSMLVLDADSYRTAIAKAPTYRAFLRHLLTEFHFIFIGFGVQDPDFDECLREMADDYGRPVRDHVLITQAIMPPSSGEDLPRHVAAQRARAVLLKRRHGIHTVRVLDYPDIPKLLADALTVAGPHLLGVIENCLSVNREVRRNAHRQLANLSEIGKRRAFNVLSNRVNRLRMAAELHNDVGRETELSELAYAITKIADVPEAKAFALKLAETTLHLEVMAHVLVGLAPWVRVEELQRLERIEQRTADTRKWLDLQQHAAPHDRLLTYARNLVALARARTG